MAKQIDINGLQEFKKKCDETYAKIGQGGGSGSGGKTYFLTLPTPTMEERTLIKQAILNNEYFTPIIKQEDQWGTCFMTTSFVDYGDFKEHMVLISFNLANSGIMETFNYLVDLDNLDIFDLLPLFAFPQENGTLDEEAFVKFQVTLQNPSGKIFAVYNEMPCRLQLNIFGASENEFIMQSQVFVSNGKKQILVVKLNFNDLTYTTEVLEI